MSNFVCPWQFVSRAYLNKNEVDVDTVKAETKKSTGSDPEFLLRFILIPRDDKVRASEMYKASEPGGQSPVSAGVSATFL